MARFREATRADALLLYTWRCQAEQAPWYEGDPTSWEDHYCWLDSRLSDPLIHILIWEDTAALGVVRIDSNGELSYYADQAKDAAEMLLAATAYAAEYGGRLKVTLDAEDTAAAEQLQAAGFHEYPARSLVYTP